MIGTTIRVRSKELMWTLTGKVCQLRSRSRLFALSGAYGMRLSNSLSSGPNALPLNRERRTNHLYSTETLSADRRVAAACCTACAGVCRFTLPNDSSAQPISSSASSKPAGVQFRILDKMQTTRHNDAAEALSSVTSSRLVRHAPCEIHNAFDFGRVSVESRNT